MEKTPLDKHNSFTQNATDVRTPRQSSSVGKGALDDNDVSNSRDVDQFIEVLHAIDDKASGLSEVPDSVNAFCSSVESRAQMYYSGDVHRKFGKSAQEDKFFMESVRRMSKLINALCEFEDIEALFNQTSSALHRAVVFLEEEFRALLMEESRNNCDPAENSQNFLKFSSFNAKHQQDSIDRCAIRREADSGDYPAYSPEVVGKLHEIASTMIAAGYEVECSQAYFLSRRNAIRNHMVKMDHDVVLNMDDVVKMPWQSLETEISRWINAVKSCTEAIFPGERRLAESVFSESPPVHRRLSSNLARLVVIQLLDFAEATAMANRSAEKMFKYLDMYEALKNLTTAISGESCSDELTTEVAYAADRIGESAVSIFCDLEGSIKSDAARTPVPGGAVHPLTRYVMNYLKYACEYKDTLEEIFGKQTALSVPVSNNLSSHDLDKETESPHNFETMASTTPFSIQVVTVMDLLDANLDRKSELYRDPSLHYIFLMNNGRYILQKVKGSPEIRQVMGDTWCRRRSTVVRQYHKNYQRETWNRVLQCLNHDGLMLYGKVNKPLLKERFKIFTTIFEEIHRTQSAWVVSDEQLQSELRISISAVVIPAYRSFVGRFRHHLDSGKQVDKYIKYQPEDIEIMIEGLFEGNNASMAKRKS